MVQEYNKPALPSLLDILHSSGSPGSPLHRALALLFEDSDILRERLVPELAAQLAGATNFTEYQELVYQAVSTVRSWDEGLQAKFIHSHPRIGEVKNLSALSAGEQSDGSKAENGETPAPTPPEVLAKLKILNDCYERRFPGLVYITFVNGRTRAEIAEEMQEKMKTEGILNDKADWTSINLDRLEGHSPEESEWRKELGRAVIDVGRIAQSRLKKLDLNSKAA